MTKEEREDALEAAIRRRTVKGWAFKDLPLAERCAIEAFLDGGDVPAGYWHPDDPDNHFTRRECTPWPEGPRLSPAPTAR